MFSDFSNPDSTLIHLGQGERQSLAAVTRGLQLACRGHEPTALVSSRRVEDGHVEIAVPTVEGLPPEHALLVARGIVAASDLAAVEDVPPEQRVDMYDDGLPFVFGAHQII